MAKFFKVDTCYQGETFPEFINLDNVDRIAVGPNILFFSRAREDRLVRVSITNESMKRLLEFLGGE